MKPLAPAMKILSGTAMVSGSGNSRGTRGRESSDSQAVRRAGQAHQTDLVAEVLVGGNPDPAVIVRHPREESGPMACVAIDILPLTPGTDVEVRFIVWSKFAATICRGLVW